MYLLSGFLFFGGGSYFGYPLLPTELMILPLPTHCNRIYKEKRALDARFSTIDLT